MKKKILSILFFTVIISITGFVSCKEDPTVEPVPEPTESVIVFNPNLSYGTMTDQDGNVYRTITIGTQTWMAENLKTTKYRNGETIQNVTGNTQWLSLNTGAYCWFNNDPVDKETYGALYNWYAATDNRNIAPTGWHIPSNDEWLTLINYLGEENIAGGKMKETGSIHWAGPNEAATNQSGFTALGVGERDGINLDFQYRFTCCRFWSLTEYDNINAWFNAVFNYATYCNHSNYIEKQFGLSVRCIKDDPETDPQIIGIPDTPITDFEGNIYNTVKIGDQIWMAENLKAKFTSDGTSVSEAYVYNDNESYLDEYGRLYTWDAAKKPFIEGWHLPSEAEWNILENTLGSDVGAKLKVGGSSGFEAKIAGYRYPLGDYADLNVWTVFWTSTAYTSDHSFVLNLFSDNNNFEHSGCENLNGNSVRLIKD
ncbi:MAG: hypothetical protein A2X13_11445 [Bacteroidetes bacterium GWC2_33_15]|nr:MAG: hypothetical protein A2X10_05470 [Bacteroidetes bacterium GWA2_33_15]OFX50755.1 MAG: hypothetical protein A2X13_11445 [Bacteroidetes bacterium GWC2_33_15]OFX62963.1 MAG: hypothetical protein A2X15_09925 [Bacteroidetes bacterium GWB2_32_14]OFX70032.1 MAG: hypothetical protein A2X14_02785 [Bacteroidetes bacterium GWD2_33_33]HAN19032.1 hypothetical protein [Bacteroidales bacterium]